MMDRVSHSLGATAGKKVEQYENTITILKYYKQGVQARWELTKTDQRRVIVASTLSHSYKSALVFCESEQNSKEGEGMMEENSGETFKIMEKIREERQAYIYCCPSYLFVSAEDLHEFQEEEHSRDSCMLLSSASRCISSFRMSEVKELMKVVR